MVIRYKEFDVAESALVCTGSRQADEQLTSKTGKGNAASSSAKKKGKKFGIFSRDGGGASKAKKVATGNEDKHSQAPSQTSTQPPGTKDLNVDDISTKSAVAESVDQAKAEERTQNKNIRKKSGVEALEWDSVKLKERLQEQQGHESEKGDQLVSPPQLNSNHGPRDIYIDSIPRKSPAIPGDKRNLKRNGEERTNTYVVSSPQGGSNGILYAKESPYNQKKNETERSSTLVLRARLHCDDCIRKIQKYIAKYKGVQSVAIDASKDQASVTGVVDMKELVSYLKDKIKRNVEVVPTRKGGDQEIKDKVDKGDLTGAEGYGKKEEQTPLTNNVNQNDYYRSLPHPVTHWNDGELNDHYGMEAYRGYMSQGISYQRFNQPYAPDIFSDDNPNACSIM